jgi:methionyl aminopeptidase
MIKIKTQEEIKKISESAKILAQAMRVIEVMVKPGTKTIDLDKAAEAFILSASADRKARPAFKGYERFPYSLCVSVNQNIVHGLPSEYVLKEGDIVGLDLGVLYQGYYSDMAITVPVGKVSDKTREIIDVTKESLEIAIKNSVVGNTVGDIGYQIQKFVEKRGFNLVKELCGHGIGKDLHEDPKIPNFGKRGSGEILQDGMVICIEPMVTAGSCKIKKSLDGYGYATEDDSLSAHFEHTIAITSKGPVILTK